MFAVAGAASGLLFAALTSARAQDFDPDREPQPMADAGATGDAGAGASPKLTKPPALLVPVEPAYPPEALAAGLSGDVTLQVDLDETGAVTQVAVTGPAGHGFDEAAVAAMKAFRFSPAEIDGNPASIRIAYVLHFVPDAARTRAARDGGTGRDGAGLDAGTARVVAPDGGAPPADAGAIPMPPATDAAGGRDGGDFAGNGEAEGDGAATGAALAPRVVLIRGVVREKGTRDPVAAADVATSFAGGTFAVTSTADDEGRFEVTGPAGQPLRVVVGDSEHEPCVRDFAASLLTGHPPIDVLCTVARRAGNLFETRVRARRPPASITRHTLEQEELTTVPGTFGDPLRVIQNLPGVARVPYGLGQLIVRGAAPQDSGVYVDGHRVPILYHFLGGPSVLTPRLIDRIDFYPGGFGVKYGRATGGIVDVTTKSDRAARLHGSADVNLLDSGAYVEGPLSKGWTGAVAARRSYVDLLLPLVIPRISSRNTTAVASPVYWDYQARLNRDLGRWGQLGLFALGSDDALAVVASNAGRDLSLSTRIGFHRLIATWTTTAGNGWVTRVSPALGVDLLRFDGGVVAIDRTARVGGLRASARRAFGPSFALEMGLDGELRQDQLNSDLPLPALRRTTGGAAPMVMHQVIPLDTATAGLYAEATWDPTSRLRVIPGLRGDVFRYVGQDRASLDPRLVVRWAQAPWLTFKAGAGIFHQPPEPQLLWSDRGNPNLSLIWSDQYHVGLESKFTEVINLDVTFYALRRHDVPVVSADSGFASSGRGRSYGMELILRHELTRRFYGWLAYTLARSEQTALGVGMTPTMFGSGIGPTLAPGTYFPTTFDQTHILTLIGSYRVGRWELGTRFRLSTGIPQTPITGSVFDADTGNYRPLQGAPGSTRRPTFHQLDFRFERTFTFDAWRLSAYLDVQNVYNAENPEGTFYDYRYRASAPIRGLPILPVIGVRGRF